MHLGEKLKLYRKKKDIDQPEMAAAIGIGYRTYQEIERTGIITKTKIKEKVFEILEEKQQKDDTQNTQKVAETSKKEEAWQIINNLTESNRMLAEANLILARKINPEKPNIVKRGNHH